MLLGISCTERGRIGQPDNSLTTEDIARIDRLIASNSEGAYTRLMQKPGRLAALC